MGTQRITAGALVGISLGDGHRAFGRVLSKTEVAFYGVRIPDAGEVDFDLVYQAPILFITAVMNDAVKSGHWTIVDRRPLEAALDQSRDYFMRDAYTGKYSIYGSVDGSIRPATEEECVNLECTAVWSACHIEDRLRDHFADVPNVWVRQMRE